MTETTESIDRATIDALKSIYIHKRPPTDTDSSPLYRRLFMINHALWRVEDALRDCERRADFGEEFVAYARSVYLLNDVRAILKKEAKSHETATADSEPLIIIPHMGLGDIFLSAPIITYFALRQPVRVLLPASKYDTCEAIFQHVPSQRIYGRWSTETEELEWVRAQCDGSVNVLYLGQHGHALDSSPSAPIFWKQFYQRANLPYTIAHTLSPIQRNHVREREFFNQFGLSANEPYVIVHDDVARGYIIRHSFEGGIRVIYTDQSKCQAYSTNLLDYCLLIERAYEFHSFDTGMSWMVELLGLRVPKKVIHAHIKSLTDADVVRLYRTPWVVSRRRIHVVSAFSRAFVPIMNRWLKYASATRGQFQLHLYSIDGSACDHPAHSLAGHPRPYPEWDTSYAWKATVIHHAMTHNASQGDVVLYLDAGVYIRDFPQRLVDTCATSLLIEDDEHVNGRWTNDVCRRAMSVTDQELDAFQLLAGIQCHVVCPESLAFVGEWKRWCDTASACVGSRANHRHDQSILSILVRREPWARHVQLVPKWGLFQWDSARSLTTPWPPLVSRVVE